MAKGLRNLKFPTVMVQTQGGEFAVLGLTPDMVLGLYHRHQGDLAALFDYVVAQGKGEVSSNDPVSIAMGLVGQSPRIMAELIALASGSDPNDESVEQDTTENPLRLTNWERDVAAARALTVPVQVDALMKIAQQTFSSDMPPGKFLTVVVQAASVTAAVANRNNLNNE